MCLQQGNKAERSVAAKLANVPWMNSSEQSKVLMRQENYSLLSAYL